MTSLFDIKFEWGSAYSGWTFYKSNEQTIINPPTELHLYLNDKIPNPATQTDYNIVYAKPAGESIIRRYKFTWKDKRTGKPWDYTNDVVFGDITLILDTCEEQYWTIYFATPRNRIYSTEEPSGNSKIIIPGRTYETVPSTIYNVRHNQTAFSSAVMSQINNYATINDSSVNKFYHSNGSATDSVEHAAYADGWYCAPYSNIGANPSPFTWGTTPVKNNYWMLPNWKFKTFTLYLNYNTGSGYYYNDLNDGNGKYTLNEVSYTSATNVEFSFQVGDGFTPNNCLNASAISSARAYEGTFCASGWYATTTKNVGWYTDTARTTAFNFDAKMEGNKRIYAKWGVKYDDSIGRSLPAPWSSASGTWYVPSYCNKIKVYLRGGGGNSSYENNAQRDPNKEGQECEICTPGGWGKTSTKSDYSNVAKKKITVNVGGPATQTSLTVNGYATQTAAAGATGAKNGKSFNLYDKDDGMEKEIGSGRLASYILKNGQTKLVNKVSKYNVGEIDGYCAFVMNGYKTSSGNEIFCYAFFGDGFRNNFYLQASGSASSDNLVAYVKHVYKHESDRGGSSTWTSWSYEGTGGDSTRKVYLRVYRMYNSGGSPVPGSPGMAFCITRSSHTQNVQGTGVGGEAIVYYMSG